MGYVPTDYNSFWLFDFCLGTKSRNVSLVSNTVVSLIQSRVWLHLWSLVKLDSIIACMFLRATLDSFLQGLLPLNLYQLWNWFRFQDGESGWSSLHRALHFGHLAVASILLQHGASIVLEDSKSRIPVDLLSGPVLQVVGTECRSGTNRQALNMLVKVQMVIAQGKW